MRVKYPQAAIHYISNWAITPRRSIQFDFNSTEGKGDGSFKKVCNSLQRLERFVLTLLKSIPFFGGRALPAYCKNFGSDSVDDVASSGVIWMLYRKNYTALGIRASAWPLTKNYSLVCTLQSCQEFNPHHSQSFFHNFSLNSILPSAHCLRRLGRSCDSHAYVVLPRREQWEYITS